MLVCVFVLIVTDALLVFAQDARAPLPPGRWTFSAGPYYGPGNESIPVDVFSVTTDASRGLTISKVSLLNRSAKEVAAIKLHWYLTGGAQGGVLQEGDTPFVDVFIPAGGRQSLEYPVVSFARVHKSLLRAGKLTGDYRIEVAVSEVEYADQSKWKYDRTTSSSTHHSAALPQMGCQGQGCTFIVNIGSYVCMAHEGTFCSVTNKGQSCTESRCGSPNDN